MIKYKVLDRSGNEIKYNQRIPDYTGMWWYFRGCYNKKYLQVVEDEREEKPRAMFASNFNVTIEAEAKPDYTKITNEGLKVLDLWTINGDSHVICKFPFAGKTYYSLGMHYDLNDGTWAYGKYEYQSRQEAQMELVKYLVKLVKHTKK